MDSLATKELDAVEEGELLTILKKLEAADLSEVENEQYPELRIREPGGYNYRVRREPEGLFLTKPDDINYGSLRSSPGDVIGAVTGRRAEDERVEPEEEDEVLRPSEKRRRVERTQAAVLAIMVVILVIVWGYNLSHAPERIELPEFSKITDSGEIANLRTQYAGRYIAGDEAGFVLEFSEAGKVRFFLGDANGMSLLGEGVTVVEEDLQFGTYAGSRVAVIPGRGMITLNDPSEIEFEGMVFKRAEGERVEKTI